MKNLKNLIMNLTLEEKASLCSGKDFWHTKGIERLGIPSIMVTDGPHGLRKQAGDSSKEVLTDTVPATCFPTASALAATWNRDLVFQVGKALGEECRQEKVGVILGPGANIKRSPLCGRNFEYFSEDPFLTGEIAKNHIMGVQSEGIGTSLKHFSVNNQEFRRMTIDAIVDDRALREIYLAGFEIAVKEAQPWTVMCAYNKVNGTYCSENAILMNDILKEEWGHNGFVVTDWGAANDRVKGLEAGIELEMPGIPNGNDEMIVSAIRFGQLEELILDDVVYRLLNIIFKAEEALTTDYSYDRDAHHALARKAAAEGAVLLKNRDNVLPLPETTKVALIGLFAKNPRYQGAGSSLMNPSKLDTVYNEMIQLIGEKNVCYAQGYTINGENEDMNLIQKALETASSAEYVVVCAGLTDMYEVEGLDRKHMKMPKGHDALIQALAETHNKVVVVLSNGSPVEMPWAEKVSGILEGYLGGQAGAAAIVDILFGKTNPSGKLAETFPLKLEDNPSHPYFPGGPSIVEYRESIFVGYRYYDTVGQNVLFPFGHGLSYTTFDYSDVRINQHSIFDSETLHVSLKVKNTGKVIGQEVVQLYVRDIESTVFRPQKELKGFEKITLKPREEKEVNFELSSRAFAFFSTALNDWYIEPGKFEILIGSSSRDIYLKTIVTVTSIGPSPKILQKGNPVAYHALQAEKPIDQSSFEELLRRPIPPNFDPKTRPYSINTPIGDVTGSLIGRLLFRFMKKQSMKMVAGQEESPTALLIDAMVREAPLRVILMASEGTISREMLDALVIMINGQFFKGFFAILKAMRARKKIQEIK